MAAKDRVAVVTGGGSGIGLAIATHLARAGRSVAIIDLDGEAADKAAAQLQADGAFAVAVHADVSDPVSVVRGFRAVREALGPVEILVTSAAIAGFTAFRKITFEEWNRYLAVNLSGTFLCLQEALADMSAAKWGRIVTISSAAGQRGAVGQGHYAATKGGVIALTKTVAQEYAPLGIAVNTVPPFVIDSPMLRSQQKAKKLPPADVLTRAIPAGRLGTGEDVAALVVFLCSDESSYVTGQVIGVNGGAVL